MDGRQTAREEGDRIMARLDREPLEDAPWLADYLAVAGSDASNVVREALREEREGLAASQGCEPPPRAPGFGDLLASARLVLEVTDRMLLEPVTTAEQSDFLTGLRTQMQETCQQIEAQIGPVFTRKTGRADPHKD
jgi:hypothetical protein